MAGNESPEVTEWKRRAIIVFDAWWENYSNSRDIDPTQTSRKTHLEAFANGYVAGAIGIVEVSR